jgi:hypothetical protein
LCRDIRGPDFCATVLEAAPLHTGLALNITSDMLLLSIPLLILLGMRTRRRSEINGVILLLSLGTVSIAMNVLRAADSEIAGFTRGAPLPLPKRNSHIVEEMFMITSMLVAFLLPSLRVLFRSSKTGRNAEPLYSRRGSGSGAEGSRDPKVATIKLFSIEHHESQRKIHDLEDN